MKPLQLHSERFSPTGNVASEGVLNQLGRPGQDVLTVLVREAVQNSWDARASDWGPVRFGIAGHVLTREEIEVLRTVVFAEAPENIGLKTEFSVGSDVSVIAIFDRGTTGLGGPTRADDPATDEPRDFVDFLRNVGQPPDRPLGAGTYGYGKTSFYVASRLRTICVHTHCHHNDRLESRFMAAALGPQFSVTTGWNKARVLYTGRHWWGYLRNGIAEPVLGRDADELGRQLGLPGFASAERGTTILILQPDFGDRTPLQAMRLMAATVVWYFWPKMLVQQDGNAAMTFELSWQGEPVPVPDPHQFPPLRGFVEAMEALKRWKPGEGRDPGMGRVEDVFSQRPFQRLGRLSLRRFPIEKRMQMDIGGNGDGADPIGKPSCHVALMRNAELVVKYLPGRAMASDKLEYGGVFITDREVDEAFAKAEPPTHDDWRYEFLQDGREKTFVRVALRNILSAMDEFAAPQMAGQTTNQNAPLAAFAERLGDLMLATEGPGASVPSAPDGSNSPTPAPQPSAASGAGGRGTGFRNRHGRARVIVPQGGGRLTLAGEVPVLVVDFEVEHAAGSAGTLVSARVAAVLDGGEMEVEPPVGEAVPEVLKWVGPDGSEHVGLSGILIPASTGGGWQVVVSVPGDLMVGVDLEAVARFSQ